MFPVVRWKPHQHLNKASSAFFHQSGLWWMTQFFFVFLSKDKNTKDPTIKHRTGKKICWQTAQSIVEDVVVVSRTWVRLSGVKGKLTISSLIISHSFLTLSLDSFHQNEAWLGSLSEPPTSGPASFRICILAWRSSVGVTTWSLTMTVSWVQRQWMWCWHTSPSTVFLEMKQYPAIKLSNFVRRSWTQGYLSRWELKYLGRKRRKLHLRTAVSVYTGSWVQKTTRLLRWLAPIPFPLIPLRVAMTHRALKETQRAIVLYGKGTDIK